MLEQWIIAMAVLLTLFHPELTESSSNCNLDKGVQIKRVDENATAFVSCGELAEDEKHISISLYKGEEKLHSTDMRNNTHQSGKFQVSKQNSSVSYKIPRTKANDTGLYSCTIIHTDITRKPETLQTILLIKAAQQPTESCPNEQMPRPLFIGYGVIILYNLVITVFSCYFARKLKNPEPPENPYINTRPGGFRRR
ncbi:hypothetical protein R3I93_004970 [Phoxinus phoxinus]|uniref:Ig-like domain-containing protein n=1 Tax=Phoxinus phoxinus TaxID=58324 RepID=A0AAN9DCJ6_9TELE